MKALLKRLYVLLLFISSQSSAQTRLPDLDSAVKADPHNAYFWQQKGMFLFKEKKYELGLPYLDSAVKYNKGEDYLEYRAFMKCIFQRSYRSAIVDFNKAKIENPDGFIMDHEFDFYLGICYLQLNQFDSAETLFTRCIEKEKIRNGETWVHYMNWFYKGIALMEKGSYAKSIDCFDHAIGLYKRFSDAKYYKAICHYRLKDSEKALALFKEAQADLKEGYTINEDNVIYETYPHQVTLKWIENYLHYLDKPKGK